MDDIKKYYEKTKNDLPNPMVKKVINMNIKHGKAIDLGCGAGRNTIYLIKNGWQVLAIDKEDTKKIILDLCQVFRHIFLRIFIIFSSFA